MQSMYRDGLICIMSASSVNTALQNDGNSNQSTPLTFKLSTLHFEERDFCVSVVAQTRTNMQYLLKYFWSACVVK